MPSLMARNPRAARARLRVRSEMREPRLLHHLRRGEKPAMAEHRL
jgi:hypothetical protein